MVKVERSNLAIPEGLIFSGSDHLPIHFRASAPFFTNPSRTSVSLSPALGSPEYNVPWFEWQASLSS